MLWRAFRKSKELARVTQKHATVPAHAIVCFVCVRNEAIRLPHFLAYHRTLGVDHFFIVDNDSDDGTAAFLTAQPDVSLWQATGSYKAARFGMDWLTALQFRHGRGRWCLTLDADELLTYFEHDTRDLKDLTAWLDRQGARSFGAVMIDLYPKGPLSANGQALADNPLQALPYLDAAPYRVTRQHRLDNDWIQGGVRDRVFFADTPARAPTLNKVPLVKWRRRYSYVNSTHQILPRALNRVFPSHTKTMPTGALLHTKFLPDVMARAKEDLTRRQHFGTSERYTDYYNRILEDPDLWNSKSVRYTGWQQLVALGFIQQGDWPDARPADR